MKKRVIIYHNILWSRYKGRVFSEIERIQRTSPSEFSISFIQIAETDSDRKFLGGSGRQGHDYPFELLYRGSYEAIGTLRLSRRLLTHAIRSNADLLLLPGWGRVEFCALLFGAMVSGKKVGMFCDSTKLDNPSSIYRNLLKRAFARCCVGFFCYGERAREYLLSVGASEKGIFIRCQAAALPPTYDARIVRDARIAARANQRHSARFLYVGRLSPEKCVGSLIEAFDIVRSSVPDAMLRIVGDGPLRYEIQSTVQRLNLNSCVEVVGSLTEGRLVDEYIHALCLVLPSSSEPWGLVVNESLSYGCPAIVSDRCGCIPELISDGETGLVFSALNTAQLAAQMISATRLFSSTPVVADACINRISRFTPQAAAEQILSGISAVLK